MSDLQAVVDRFDIETLRGEFTDAVMMRDYGRVASLFTPDGVWRMPNIPDELAGQEEIRAYIQELIRLRDGNSEVNYAIYHDRYQRTPHGWKFTERVYEIRYLDTSPLTGSAPPAPRFW